MKYFTKIGIGICLALSIWSCQDDEDFSDIPELFFRDFEVFNTNNDPNEAQVIAVWKLGFTDGDGNIGVRDENDSNNFIVSGFRYEQGQLIALPQLEGYRIPNADDISTKDGIEGEFKFELGLDTYIALGWDSLYLEGYVVDRAFNRSNTIATPIFLD